MRHIHESQPLLITTVPQSPDDEYEQRRKRYAILMSLRAVCVIAAAATYRFSVLLALAFVVGGAILPWCAVLIANNRPAKKRPTGPRRAPVNTERAITGQSDRTIDG